METQHSIFKDKGFIIGLILIILSFAFFLILKVTNSTNTTDFIQNEGIFFMNYIIALLYFIGTIFISFFKNWFDFSKYNHRHFICSLLLLSISCFTLNITFHTFSDFGQWMDIYLIAMHLSLLVICFYELLPKSIRMINFFILGLGAIMAFYFAIYLAALSIIGVIALIAFGLGIHFMAPAILLSTILVQVYKRIENRWDKMAFYAGIALPLFILVTYAVKWNQASQLIHETHAAIVTRPDNKLPNWVLLSQELEDDFITERIIKGDLVYETKIFNGMRFGRNNRTSLGEVKEHDPLVAIGSELFGKINIDKEDRIKILESKFDLRHQTKRKLWSGKHLSTTSVLSNIQVFPDYRLAYTEKIIRIKNNYNSRWNRQEEALYTFHLPEGSVATSLSLWIDGKEEKSRLTTKSKATKAYTNIVGVERRDPSILHWQEGNTITVYVFPCTTKEERMFKIGITSPLKYEKDQLVLQNVYFNGPDASDALETSVIEFFSDVAIQCDLPGRFDEIIPNKFQYTGNYHAYWEANCLATPLSKEAFSFQGNSYQIREAVPQFQNTDMQRVYLDINASWSKKEFDEVWNTLKGKNVYVFYDKLFQLNEDNKTAYFDLLNGINFSLFPLQEIKDAEHSLLISKSTSVAPMLKDLKGSAFIDELKIYLLERSNRINLYNLSDELSPYLKTLKEFQVFNYSQGDITSLGALINKKQFIQSEQDENSIELTISHTQIIRDSSNLASTAPDHLMRLFAYNKIMKDCGRNYFTSGDYVEDSLIELANLAYIVSPVSSLIVLESIQDYKRFDIDENKNSLKNASTQSAGAVPEPHEWALILLLSGTLFALYYKRRSNSKIS